MIQLTAACGGALCFKYTKKTPPTLIVNSFLKSHCALPLWWTLARARTEKIVFFQGQIRFLQNLFIYQLSESTSNLNVVRRHFAATFFKMFAKKILSLYCWYAILSFNNHFFWHGKCWKILFYIKELQLYTPCNNPTVHMVLYSARVSN